MRIIQKTWAGHSERLQAQQASRNAEARKIKDNHAVMAKRRQKFEAEMEPDSEHCLLDLMFAFCRTRVLRVCAVSLAQPAYMCNLHAHLLHFMLPPCFRLCVRVFSWCGKSHRT